MRADATLHQLLDKTMAIMSDPNVGPPAGSCGALAGSMAAALIAAACAEGIEQCRSEKAEDELRDMRRRCLSLRCDLLALVDHGAAAATAMTDSQRPGRASANPAQSGREKLRALLFASEVPLRTAESCHALLNLALRTLSKTGIRGIADIGTGAALAFAGVIGGIVTTRSYLAVVPPGAEMGVAEARRRAERILRDAEALRTQITDRVRQHLP